MPAEETTTEGKRTRRSAGKKASQLASEQLQNSPTRSEDEHGLPLFGEPSRPRAQVKVTYAGKKSKSLSPTKSSPSHLPDAKSVPKRPVPSTPTPSRSRVRSATLRGQKGVKQSIGASSLATIQPTSTHGKTTTALFPKSAEASTRAARIINTNSQNNRKRRLSISTHHASESEAESALTPLASPEPESASNLGRINGHEPSRMPATPQKRNPFTRRTVQEGEEEERVSWMDGDLVWVHLDASGAVSESPAGMWWPAQVTSTSPLKVTTFGQGPGDHISPSGPELTISTTSRGVISPMRTSTRKMRFDETTYVFPAVLEDSAGSSRKRQRTEQVNLTGRWKDARDLMLQAYEDKNDGFPLLLSHYKGSSPSKSLNGSSSLGSTSESDSNDGIENMWMDPGPNPMFDIPGELVLAREKPKYKQYWPAKVLQYIDRKRPNDKEKYEVLYFDGIHKVIPRDMILSTYDDGFATCQMGDSEDNYGLNEEAEIEKTGYLNQLLDEDYDEETLRAASPTPVLPREPADFLKLSMPEQFEYTTPVLASILNGLYSPATDLHVGFMKSGKSRGRVVSAAWKRGELSHQEKEELAVCIRRWMKKRGKRQALGLIAEDTRVESTVSESSSVTVQAETRHDDEAMPLPGSQLSVVATERAPSSDAEEPPSSFVSSSMVEVDQSDSMSIDEHRVWTGNGPESQANNEIAAQKEKNTVLSEHDVEDASCSTSPTRTLPTYAMLSDIDQITYCTSVLLPEAILQVLLWRNGLRKTPELLSDEEEKNLHLQGEKLASATYWVHDIIFMKRSVERKTLPHYRSHPQDEYSLSGRVKRRTLRD